MALAIDAAHLAIGTDHCEAVVIVRPVRLEEAGRDGDVQRFGERLHRQHSLVLASGGGVGEYRFVLDPAEIFALEQFGRQDHLRAARRRLAHQSRDVADILVNVGRERELQRGDGDFGHDAPCRASGGGWPAVAPRMRRNAARKFTKLAARRDRNPPRREGCAAVLGKADRDHAALPPEAAAVGQRRIQPGICWLMQWKLPPPVRMLSARRPTALRSGNSAWIAATAASSFAAPYSGTTTAALPM